MRALAGAIMIRDVATIVIVSNRHLQTDSLTHQVNALSSAKLLSGLASAP